MYPMTYLAMLKLPPTKHAMMTAMRKEKKNYSAKTLFLHTVDFWFQQFILNVKCYQQCWVYSNVLRSLFCGNE